MCNESKNLIKDDLLILRLTKKYLQNNKNKLIDYGIQKILDSSKRYRYDLLEKEENFRHSVQNDFDLIIEYCDSLNDDIYEDNRMVLDSFDRIYCDFYQYIFEFVNIENIEDEWLKDNLKDAFEFLANKHCIKFHQ